MKQLICEMCGSKDILKQDGVFVCQSCGCKYSVEEARKMMIEGTVDVAGTVKVDDTAKVDNYLALSRNAYDSRNGQSAIDYANKALEIDAKNPKAWIAKMKAIEHIGTLSDTKLIEMMEAGRNAIEYSEEDSKKDITFEVYLYEAKRALSLLRLASQMMGNSADIKKTYAQFRMINALSATQNTTEADRKAVNLYDNLAHEALAVIRRMPDEILVDYPEIADVVSACAMEYATETYAMVGRMNAYGALLPQSTITIRMNNKAAIKERADAAKRVVSERKAKEQADRNERYWEKHRVEKQALDSEKAKCEERIDALTEMIEALPEVDAVRGIEERIEELEEERCSLGLFKGKEKKKMQRQIDRLRFRLTKAKSEETGAIEPIQAEIDSLDKRIKEIDDELTMDR